MGKIRAILILIFVVAALGAGVYFKDDFLLGVKKLQRTEIGNIITEAGKEIFTPPPLNVGGTSKNVVLEKSKAVQETNIQRENNGLPALLENYNLEQAALAKVNDMFLSQYFEHVSPSGAGPGDLAKKYGYEFIIEGENLILGNFADEKEMIELWMNSPGHRANILNNRYTEIGMAVVRGTYRGDTVWIGVQEFGLPLSSCSEPSAALENQINSNKSQLDYFSSEIERLNSEINSINKRNPQYKNLIDAYNQLVEQYNQTANETKNLINQYNQEVNSFNNCVSEK